MAKKFKRIVETINGVKIFETKGGKYRYSMGKNSSGKLILSNAFVELEHIKAKVNKITDFSKFYKDIPEIEGPDVTVDVEASEETTVMDDLKEAVDDIKDHYEGKKELKTATVEPKKKKTTKKKATKKKATKKKKATGEKPHVVKGEAAKKLAKKIVDEQDKKTGPVPTPKLDEATAKIEEAEKKKKKATKKKVAKKPRKIRVEPKKEATPEVKKAVKKAVKRAKSKTKKVDGNV